MSSLSGAELTDITTINPETGNLMIYLNNITGHITFNLSDVLKSALHVNHILHT